jgi:hypothetical protein
MGCAVLASVCRWQAASRRLGVAAVLALFFLLPANASGATYVAFHRTYGTYNPGTTQNWVAAEYGASGAYWGYVRAALRSAAPGAWEIFEAHNLGGGWYALRSIHTGRWLAADPGVEGGLLIANRTQVGPWEKFQINQCTMRTDIYCLKANSTGKWVSADMNKDGKLIANRDAFGPWEQFNWFKVQVNVPCTKWGVSYPHCITVLNQKP